MNEAPEVLELCLHDALFRTVELVFAGSVPVRIEHWQVIQEMTSDLATELRNLAFALTPESQRNHVATVAAKHVEKIQQDQQGTGSLALTTMFKAIGAGIDYRSTPFMLLIVVTALAAYVGLDQAALSSETQLLIPAPLTAREAALVDIVSCLERSQTFARLDHYPVASGNDWNYAIQALEVWVGQAYADHPQVLQEHKTMARKEIQAFTVRQFSISTILDIMLRKALLRGAEDVYSRSAPDNVSLLLALQMSRAAVSKE